MIVNHCAAHKVNLAVQDAIKNDLAFKTIVDIFKDIHSYYNESKKIVQLKETCSKLKMTYQKVKKPSATRWLSRSQTFAIFDKMLPAFFEDLSKH